MEIPLRQPVNGMIHVNLRRIAGAISAQLRDTTDSSFAFRNVVVGGGFRGVSCRADRRRGDLSFDLLFFDRHVPFLCRSGAGYV